MQKKYFKCYFCKIGNSYLVPIEQKGKECRCCQAYNYFYTNNHSNYNHEKKNNNKNYNNNHNRKNNYNNNNHNNNNRYYKKRKNNHYNHQNISNNNNYRGNQESSNNDYFSRTNNNFYYIPNVSHNSNISYINFNDNISFGQNNNRRNDEQISALNRMINNMLISNNMNHFRNNINQINNYNKDKIKQDNNNIIKYSWLKKEKLTQEIMKEKKCSYECTICLEKLNINDDINILKCGHIFHYNCIENVVDHHLSRCPNCRCDLKTGEKQPNNQNINDDIFMDYPNLDFDIIDDDNFDEEYFI